MVFEEVVIRVETFPGDIYKKGIYLANTILKNYVSNTYGINHADGLRKSCPKIGQSQCGTDSKPTDANGEHGDICQEEFRNEQVDDVKGLLIDLRLEFLLRNSRVGQEIIGKMADELTKDYVHQGHGNA